jgi:hypothetical protein
MSDDAESLLQQQREQLIGAYRDFNERRLEAVLARMHPEVRWSNGWEGGYVHGHEGVRDYWTRQWAVLDPKVEPQTIEPDDQGRMVVRVHQVVHDRDGNLLVDTIVHHEYRFKESLIVEMDIQ